MSNRSDEQMIKTDAVLIGAGIMTATLSALLCLVEPDWSSIDVG
ncbi:malate:quinone oxidoreductase [Mycolicibacterium sp. 120322]